MIRIERGAEVDGPDSDKRRHGIWEYSCPAHPLVRGYSRQPLLDACRQLKSLYGVTADRAGLFRKGFETADISCPIETGAATTVCEESKGTIRFRPYRDLSLIFRPPPDNPSPPDGMLVPLAVQPLVRYSCAPVISSL